MKNHHLIAPFWLGRIILGSRHRPIAICKPRRPAPGRTSGPRQAAGLTILDFKPALRRF